MEFRLVEISANRGGCLDLALQQLTVDAAAGQKIGIAQEQRITIRHQLERIGANDKKLLLDTEPVLHKVPSPAAEAGGREALVAQSIGSAYGDPRPVSHWIRAYTQ